MARVMTNFDPRRHGFHFANRFVNSVLDTPFGDITTKGRCGGMAFAALDYYYANLPVPTHRGSDFPGGEVPPDGSRLADYIYRRLMDSFWLNGAKFIAWTQKLDHSTWVWGEGVSALTKQGEFPKLLQALTHGPVALGLIKAEHLWDIGKNHQVVAYGAELDEATGTMTVHIYDNNAPDQSATLTSHASERHFTSSLVGQDGNHFTYRGWFVEEYSRVTPTYIDLAVTRGLTLSNPHPQVGDSVDCTFVVRNFGDFPVSLSSLHADLTMPPGVTPVERFPRDTAANALAPGQEHTFSRHCDPFAEAKGRYTLKITYLHPSGVKIPNIPTEFGGQFIATGEVAVDVQYFSQRITAVPPYVKSIEAVYVTQGATGPLKPCEQPRVKYSAAWEYGGTAGTRRLQSTSEPIIPMPNKRLVFGIRFATAGSMVRESVKLTLTGRAADGTQVNVSVPLTGNHDYFTGSWSPEHRGSAAYKLALRIEGKDDVPRYAQRTPRGDVLDSRPQTEATVNTGVAGFPFVNYEPGVDTSYEIELAPKLVTLPADALEVNDNVGRATQVILKDPTPAAGAWKKFEQLNFHTATDQEFFALQFESLPGDDTCQLNGPTVDAISDFLGLSVTNYPPSLLITVKTAGTCIDIDLYKVTSAGPQLHQSLAKEHAFLLYNPARSFANKQLFAVMKNANFAYQGAFTYGVEFGYVPAHSVIKVDTGAPAYGARPDIRRKFLDRLFDVIDLPRPGADLLDRVADHAFPYPADSLIISKGLAQVLEQQQAFLNQPETLAEIDALLPGKGRAVLAGALKNLTELAKAAMANVDVDVDVRPGRKPQRPQRPQRPGKQPSDLRKEIIETKR